MADPAPSERRPRTPRHRNSDADQQGPEGRPPLGRSRFIALIAVLLAVNWLLMSLLPPPGGRPVDVPYSPVFLEQVREGNVERIAAEGTTIEGEFSEPVEHGDQEPSTRFHTEVPVFADEEALSELLQEQGVVIEAEPIGQRGMLLTLLLGFGPVLLLVALFIFLIRRAGQGGGLGGLGSFSRSRAKRVEQGTQQVTFADVAGIDEAKGELTEIVDFLRNPERYRRLGGRIPRGVLLSGAPGTGKTLLARAIAGEAGVPFFSSSASEFVEAIVGIGASRVRDLFKEAKEAAPAIIFVDELDAIGRKRGANVGGLGGGNDEREQTLNQILTEMDGFESDATVIVLGATNRPEVLDAALLRPGRFDRRVVVPAPDKEGRRKILDVHTRSLPLADDVSLDRVAQITPGMVGADLANLANEAALLAARLRHEKVEMSDFTDALEKIVLGAPRGVLISDEDRRRTAYHEAGHAIVGMLTAGADPVRKVSIIPRGQALGVTFSAPEEDRSNYETSHLLARLRVMLGGRVAEELVLDSITTGAESDIQHLTAIARQMVGRWGMSDLVGPVAVLPSESAGPLMPGASSASERTQRLVDEEVRRLVEEAQDDVRHLLTVHRDKLDALAEALLREETLDQDAAYEAAGLDASGEEKRTETDSKPRPVSSPSSI
jgi:cell division protease FtsH